MITKEQVQNSALTLFSRHGLKSVNMDDLARELSVSKKTIYQVYNSKEDLVLSLFEKISVSWNDQVQNIISAEYSAIIKFLQLTTLRYQFVKKLNPSFLLKSRSHYHKVYAFMIDINQSIHSLIIDLLEGAKKEGTLRKDINVTTFINAHEIAFNAYFEHYNPIVPGSEETFKHMIIAPIAGICIPDKIDVWDEYSLVSDHSIFQLLD